MGFVDSLTGKIEKARLLIIDYEGSKKARKEGEVNRRESVALKLGRNESVKSFDVSKDGQAQSVDIKYKEFAVMFNPTEITLQGRAGGSVPRRDYSTGNNGQMVMGEAPLNITFNTRLIFDRVVPGDAFTGFTSTSLSAGIQRGASLISKEMSMSSMLGGGGEDPGDPSRDVKKNKYVLDPHSVRGEVEALIAAIRNPDTRILCFTWGEAMAYTGVLNNVSAEYAMFNTNGEPIRAYVDLSITIADDKYDRLVMLTSYLWNQRLKSAFGDDRSYVNAGQKAGSLLGLS